MTASAQVVTVVQALVAGAGRLADAGVETPQLDARVLLSTITGLSAVQTIAHPEMPLTPDQSEAYEAAVARRARREPVALITGRREFYGIEFEVNRHTLVPRPETELLVEQASRLAASLRSPRILDAGTGSGCIAIALALQCPTALVDATDLSPEALTVAAANARKHGVQEQVRFSRADLVPRDATCGCYDIIVSNPPYIPSADIDSLQPEVRLFEPRQALDGGIDGLAVIRSLCELAALYLKQGGALIFECGAGQAQAAAREAAASKLELSAFYHDLAQTPRVVHLEKP